MKLSELVKKLGKALETYGDMDVLMETQDDVNINGVFKIDNHIRITDIYDVDDMYDVMGEIEDEYPKYTIEKI